MELWDIDEEIVPILDAWEGVDLEEALLRRELVETVSGVRAWTYVWNRPTETLPEIDGDWRRTSRTMVRSDALDHH